jgi:hypothetical protein
MRPSMKHPRSVILGSELVAVPHLDPRLTFSISATATSGQWSLVRRVEHLLSVSLRSFCA